MGPGGRQLQPAVLTMTTFTLFVPTRGVNNTNSRSHWRVVAKNRAMMRAMARDACTGLPGLVGRVELVALFAFPDNRPRDLDNYEIKAAIDGAVDAGLLTDDRSKVLRPVTRDEHPFRSPKGFIRIDLTFKEVT